MTDLTLSGFEPFATFEENTVNSAPQLLDTDVIFAATGSDFEGGTLTITGLLPEDQVSVANAGTGPGQIGLTGTTVTYEGTTIGALTGGIGGDLSIAFTAAATVEAIDALIESLTYANSSDTPIPSRDLLLSVIDAAGNELTPEVLFVEVPGTANPFASIDDGYKSKPSFVDLDGDGDLDLVVGGQYGVLNVFRNDGGSFAEVTGAANPFAGIDVISESAPSFADLDGDGDLDLVVGKGRSGLDAFRNDEGIYTALEGSANPFDGLGGDFGLSTPSFADLDGDGDLDLVSGEFNGSLKVFRNDAGNYTEVTGASNPLDGIGGFGYYSAPTFADLDGDGDLELVIGSVPEGLSVYEAPSPGISITVNVVAEDEDPRLTGLERSVTFLQSSGIGTPQVLDADVVFAAPDDDFEGGALTVTGLLPEDQVSVANAGSGPGQIGLTGTMVTFEEGAIGTLTGGVGEDLSITFTAAATVAAIDALIESLTYANSSDTPILSRDLLINVSNAAGKEVAPERPYIEATGAASPFDRVDVDFLSAPGFADLDDEGDLDLVVGEVSGAVNVFRNDQGSYTALTGADNPFDDIDVGGYSTPSFADLDRDGNLDLVVGDFSGRLSVYEAASPGVLFTVDITPEGKFLSGGIFSDVIEGGGGDDTINGGGGNDLLVGAEGNDTIHGNAGDDRIRGDAGDDILLGGIGHDTIDGDAGDDTITGAEGSDILSGGAGNDILSGNAGIDTLFGGVGDDILNGGVLSDMLFGEAGNDLLIGQTGFDTLSGGDGKDRIFGGAGADRISGDAGNDILTGGTGADVFVFNGGRDKITDYSLMVDRLELDAVALQIEGLTGGRVVSKFGEVIDGDTVLKFLTGDVLTLTGITNIPGVLGSTIDVI